MAGQTSVGAQLLPNLLDQSQRDFGDQLYRFTWAASVSLGTTRMWGLAKLLASLKRACGSSEAAGAAVAGVPEYARLRDERTIAGDLQEKLFVASKRQARGGPRSRCLIRRPHAQTEGREAIKYGRRFSVGDRGLCQSMLPSAAPPVRSATATSFDLARNHERSFQYGRAGRPFLARRVRVPAVKPEAGGTRLVEGCPLTPVTCVRLAHRTGLRRVRPALGLPWAVARPSRAA